jgi:propanol-preferring alcohol dehydrogenase
MKAMVLHSPAAIDDSPLKLLEIPAPLPTPGQVRVKVEVCAICRTDLHVIEGELPPKAERIVPGHQVVGTVDGTGEGAVGFQEGDRVGIAWLRHTCGQCRFCRSGRENLCPAARFTGYHEDGGYAEYAVVDEEFAYSVPASLHAAEAAPLLCAGIIG